MAGRWGRLLVDNFERSDSGLGMQRLVVAAVVLCGGVARLGAQIDLEPDSVSKDYSAELPRIAPTEPRDALATFQIAEGFAVELAASEPLVADPVAMAFDEHGRLFVVCMQGYSEQGDDRLGVVRLLTDSNDDGVFDAGVDFLTGLSWPTAIACHDGGVFVAAAPDVFYCKDADGDGRADETKVVFTGFGRGNVQGLINSFRWGLDNRLYAAAGLNENQIASPGGNGETQTLRGVDFSFDPVKLDLRRESGGAQHGATFDRWGERFVCSNSDHLQWVEYDARYLERNGQLSPPPARRSIAVDGPSAPVYRASEVEPWRIVRTRLRVKGMVSGPVEGGGRPAGYFTSASGVTAYLGDGFGEPYDSGDYIFVGDVGGNLVHLKRVDTNGLDKTATRATAPEKEFLTSTDTWFRPVQFANGPDGALYVLDMYRETIEHPLSLPPMIKQHLDLTSGRTRGRIYRITPTNWTRPSRPNPGDVDESELVSLLGHRNGWHRETAARLIVEHGRASPEAAQRLAIQLVDASRNAEEPIARIRALYCLHTLDRLADADLAARLQDPHPQVRRHALKIAESPKFATDAVVQAIASLATDPAIEVRFQLALSLGAFDWDARCEPLVALALQEGDDAKMRFAVLSSMRDDRLVMLSALLSRADWGDLNRDLPREIVREIGADGRELAATLTLFDTLPRAIRDDLTAAALRGVGRRGPALIARLAEVGVSEPKTLVGRQLELARQAALDGGMAAPNRVVALHTLCLGEFDLVGETLAALLSPLQPPALREATVAELGEFSDQGAGRLLLESSSSLAPEARRNALDLLTSRDAWAELLLQALTDGSLAPGQLSARHRQRLLEHRNPRIAESAKSILGGDSDRAAVVERLAHVLDGAGDAVRGAEVFRKTCASCHRLDGHGSEVGPNLEPLRNRGAAFLLTNILDPNQEVDPRYEAYVAVTSDGRSVSGILATETPAAITLLAADGNAVEIDRPDLEVFQSSGKSLMPEGLERDLTEQSLADVLAYLIQPAAEPAEPTP